MRAGGYRDSSWEEIRTMATSMSDSGLLTSASAADQKPLPTTDTKGSPCEHFNRPLYSQILQARRLLVSEAGRAEKRAGACRA